MKYKDEVDNVKKKLTDIQSATVDYLYKRMYEDEQHQLRMLVADDVGLGKTWVAKGLVARIYENQLKLNKPLNVYYICSNQQLAAQNLKQINFTNASNCIVSDVNRISLLALKQTSQNVPIQIFSLTPSTSFSSHSSQGIKKERYIIYKILAETCDFKESKKILSDLLMGYDRYIDWNVDKFKDQIRVEIKEKYAKRLKHTKVELGENLGEFGGYQVHHKNLYDVLLYDVLPYFSVKRTNFNQIIGQLRKVMRDVCLDLMNADIYILDEFQRYSNLIEVSKNDEEVEEDEQLIVAHKVFAQQNARILMLSATPFKVYTTQTDEQLGQQHYKEMERVLHFLYEGKNIDWKYYEDNRNIIFSKMLSLKDAKDRNIVINEIEPYKKKVENIYAGVICRTEKIIASNDPNAMVKDVSTSPIAVKPNDIADFINMDNIFKSIYNKNGETAPSPLEYVKSAPYSMSFLKDYKVGEKASGIPQSLNTNAFVNFDAINSYSFHAKGDWPNSKFKLLTDTIEQDSMLLWCPPSMPYYSPKGAFEGKDNFSKTLVFSAWKLVPKMIATLVSYDAEKYTIGKLRTLENTGRIKLNLEDEENEKGIKYFPDRRSAGKGDEARKPRRRLVFRKKKGIKGESIDTQDQLNMTTLLLAYPSWALADNVDPKDYLKKAKTPEDIIDRLAKKWNKQIISFCKTRGTSKVRKDAHVTWAFPIMQDVVQYDSCMWIPKANDFVRRNRQSKLTSENDSKPKESLLTKDYMPYLQKILKDKHVPELPYTITSEQIEKQSRMMALLSLASPAICTYRSLRRYYKENTNERKNILTASAFMVGLAFIDLFNKPESIAVIELQYNDEKIPYWEKVLRYCLDGNIQAMLDEYVFMLQNDYDSAYNTAEAICKVLGLRTSHLKVDNASTFTKEIIKGKEFQDDVRQNLRSHYAAAFGVNTMSSTAATRSVTVREAFNSPFRPFVLATTSIGQEGLDFHWYCRRVMHWNLPENAIDLEQREGRVNRFRGLVIRQRTADQYKKQLEFTSDNPWDEVFEKAKENRNTTDFKCDIIPNWIFNSNNKNAVSIERVVPLIQYSQDIQRYESMLHVLGLYRLTFGQPRQEELMSGLNCNLKSEQINKMILNLCPLKRKGK